MKFLPHSPPSATGEKAWLSRRALIRNGVLCLAGLGGSALRGDSAPAPLVRVGLMADLHYADKTEKGTRFYRQALDKIDEAVARFNELKPDMVVELGDLIDQASSVEEEAAWLATMESHYAKLVMPRHYVLGNHCVATLTKPEFQQGTGAGGESYYTVEKAGVTFLILDSCFKEDGTPYGRGNADWKDANIPAAELKYIQHAMDEASGPVVILAHQRLDAKGHHSVRNAAAIRAVLEKSGKVAAVLQGHSHANDLQEIAGIPYVTLAAMIEGSGEENNSYSLLEVHADGSLKINGFRKQSVRLLPKR